MLTNLFSSNEKSLRKPDTQDEFPSIHDYKDLDVEFKGLVDTFSELGLSHKIKNDNAVHAEYALISLFNYADRRISILTECLNSKRKRSREYLTALYNFVMKPGSEINVVVERNDEDSQALNLLKYLGAQQNTNIHIRQLTNIEAAKTEGQHSNYTIVDDIGYRFEYLPEHKKAHVCFNNRERASELLQHYKDIVLPNSIEITSSSQICIEKGKHIVQALDLR